MDPSFRAALLKRARTPEEEETLLSTLGLHPITGEIVTIGLLDPDTGEGAAYYQAPGELPLPFTEDGVTYEAGTEAEIIARFWEHAREIREIITFNGRGFDCPFIIARGAVHRIRPTRELMPPRFGDFHIDLYDRLTYFGAAHRKHGLDLWCRALGIPSPKTGIDGSEVSDAYHAGRYLEIARYCMGDVRATSELHSLWRTYMK